MHHSRNSSKTSFEGFPLEIQEPVNQPTQKFKIIFIKEISLLQNTHIDHIKCYQSETGNCVTVVGKHDW